ncbi:MAG: tetratricopeptide repeat protein [Pseudomonadota bacterium]
MPSEHAPITPNAASTRRLLACAGLLILGVVGGLAISAPARTARVTRAEPSAPALSVLIETSMAARGRDAALAQYQALRASGFAGVAESESDTNRLGYRLLGKKRTQDAIAILELNAQTHPDSANAHDSLGEAYVAAGDTDKAIASYRRAASIAPTLKSARAELHRLAGDPGKTYPPLLLLHIGAGMLGLGVGALALALRKGARQHAIAGSIFVAAMLAMSGSAALRAYIDPNGDPANIAIGIFTFYLVSTAWLAAKRRQARIDALDWGALLVVAMTATGLFRIAIGDGPMAMPAAAFGAMASMAALLDVRMLMQGGVAGAHRIARHLWRMCLALFIATTSFFLGQSQAFPYAVRASGVLTLPGLLIAGALVFWLVRTLFTKKIKQAPTAP